MNKRHSIQFLLFVCLIVSAAEAQSTQRRVGSITGRVVTEDGSLVTGARVIAGKFGATVQSDTRTQTVDEEGNFTINNLEARVYRLNAYLPGYVIANVDDSLSLARVGDNVTVNLTKGGVITGRVTDQSGEPVIGIRVSTFRVKDATGKAVTTNSTMEAGGLMAATDDRGIYRAYGLAAGSYVVSTISTNEGLGGSPYLGTVAIYHPSNTREGATEVQVQPGSEASGIDIRYRAELGHSISGKVSGSITGTSASSSAFVSDSVNVNVTMPGSQQSIAQAYVQTSNGQSSFEVKGLANGDYDVSAFRLDREGLQALSAPRRISVRNADVGGLELALGSLASIKGKFVVEAPPILKPEEQALCVKGRPAALYEIALNAHTVVPRKGVIQLPSYLISNGTAPEEDGSFIVKTLDAGQYRLRADLPGTSWYIKSIALDTPKTDAKPVTSHAGNAAKTPANAGLLTLKSGEALTGVIVTLAENAAQLRGKLESKPSGRVRVHLVPVEAAWADDVLRYDEVIVRNDGSFAFEHLAPGKYWLITKPVAADEPEDRAKRMLAWDAIARAALRKEAEAKAQAVELGACVRISDYKLR